MSTGYIHGGTSEREVARLEKQARFTASFTFPRFDAAPGMRVLDLATGVGAMAGLLRESFPGIALTGVDLSSAQLAAARRNHRDVPIVRADATRLPFADETFDRVHCSWLLEHVPSPVAVLREVRRVLKRGGYCQFIEVDNATFGTTPMFDEVTQVMRALNAGQARAGGDPYVGQVLHRHFAAAGFRKFTVEPNVLRASAANADFLRRFVEEFAEIFEGLDETLGAQLGPVLPKAVEQLRSLTSRSDAQMRYVARIACGWR